VIEVVDQDFEILDLQALTVGAAVAEVIRADNLRPKRLQRRGNTGVAAEMLTAAVRQYCDEARRRMRPAVVASCPTPRGDHLQFGRVHGSRRIGAP